MILRKMLPLSFFWKSTVLVRLSYLPVYCGRWRVQRVVDEPHVSLVQLQRQRVVVSFVQ